MRNVRPLKVLRVDLTRRTVSIDQFDEHLYRLFPGGKALAAYLLLHEFVPDVDPLDPRSVLVLANGLLTGAPFSGATRFTVAAHSPLTGAYGESEAGGFWGPELKMAGFEAIVIKGRAEQPVYLSIRDANVGLRDARHLWGCEPEEAQAKIREELGDKLVRVLQIGAGGENQVRFASITNNLRHFNGRTGMGAVMGSKNLKAVAVRGTGRYTDFAEDPRALIDLGRVLAKRVQEHPMAWDLQLKGTPGAVEGLNATGILPTRNFRQGAFEGVDGLKWAVYEKELLAGRGTCYACAIRCRREVKIDDRYQVRNVYNGPDYEAIGGFGSNCGVNDLQAVAKANELCARFTLDTISTSAVISFAMECFEQGLIGPGELGGLDLRFGNAEAMLKTIELIAFRKGIGDLLAQGVRHAAEMIGGNAKRYAMHSKGQELPLHDPRGKVAVGLGYAVSETGADHLVAYHDSLFANAKSVSFESVAPLGITEALPARELSETKVQQYVQLENWSSVGKITGLCYFAVAPRSLIQVDEVVAAVRAVTGWDVTLSQLLRMGERATNLSRAFNVVHGWSRQDDTLPERLFQPLQNGALAGAAIDRTQFERAMTELYRLKQWDPNTAAPTRKRLCELEIEWVADLLSNRQSTSAVEPPA